MSKYRGRIITMNKQIKVRKEEAYKKYLEKVKKRVAEEMGWKYTDEEAKT
jgi:hypothetical protein